LIGKARIEVGDLITKKQIELMDKFKAQGYLIIQAATGAVLPPAPPPAYLMQFSAKNLDKKGSLFVASMSMVLANISLLTRHVS
jgi:hypothetical protein